MVDSLPSSGPSGSEPTLCLLSPAKPIAEAIENAAVDPSHSLELFPANAVFLVQFNYDGATSTGPNFGPGPNLNGLFVLTDRLLQQWIFGFERSPAQFICHPFILRSGFLKAHAWSAQDFRHFLLRH